MQNNKEDFTLLNLSKSSSSLSESEDLFPPPENRLPKRKRRTKRRPGSHHNHQSPNSSSKKSSSCNSNSPSFSGAVVGIGSTQQNLLYTVFIFLFCWVGTLTWLVFSLRNQLTDATDKLDQVTKLSMKDFPDQLDSLNRTLLNVNHSLVQFNTTINLTIGQLLKDEKNFNTSSVDLLALQKNVADLGSSLKPTVAELQKQVKELQAKAAAAAAEQQSSQASGVSQDTEEDKKKSTSSQSSV